MKKKKTPVSSDKVFEKKPYSKEPTSFYDRTPVWSFEYIDINNEKWGLKGAGDKLFHYIQWMKNEASREWKDILADTRNGNSRHHPIQTNKIVKDAQQWLHDHKFDEYDSLYSLAISNKIRMWGTFRSDGVFMIIFLDSEHQVYPTKKK